MRANMLRFGFCSSALSPPPMFAKPYCVLIMSCSLVTAAVETVESGEPM